MTEQQWLGNDEIAECEQVSEDQAQWEAEQRAELEMADRLDGYDPAEPWMDAHLDAWARGDE